MKVRHKLPVASEISFEAIDVLRQTTMTTMMATDNCLSYKLPWSLRLWPAEKLLVLTNSKAGLLSQFHTNNLQKLTVNMGLILIWQACYQQVHTKDLQLVTVLVGLKLMWQGCSQPVLIIHLQLITVLVGLTLMWQACNQQVHTKALHLVTVYVGLALM